MVDDRRIAIEVELSPKAPRRLRAIVAAVRKGVDSLYLPAGVVRVVPLDAVCRRLGS
jgi:hypothetical protein